MDYKFTFEDGSEYLMHHGVKGMTWRKGKKGKPVSNGLRTRGMMPIIGNTNKTKQFFNTSNNLKRSVSPAARKSTVARAGKILRKRRKSFHSSSRIKGKNMQAKVARAATLYSQIKAEKKARRQAGYND